MSANKKAPNCWHSIGARQDFACHPVPIITRSPRHYKRRVRFRLTPANVALVLLLVGAAIVIGTIGYHAARTGGLLSMADDIIAIG